MTRRIAALAALMAAACARPGVRPVTPAAGEARCTLATGAAPATRRALTTVALTEPVDPDHAPVARNDAERIVFRQLYETLVQVDCEGRVVPGLAESWTSSDGGRRWTLTLRADAQFWDGAPVTARDAVVGKSGSGFTLTALDARTVSVALARASEAPPAFLADPALAITKPAPDRGWSIGTGRYWVTGATVTDEEIRAHSAAGDTLVFRLPAPPPAPAGGSRDPRDLLDDGGGVDLLVTRDRAVVDYAATQPRFAALELPWDRVYVFASPTGAEPPGDGVEQAVRAEARRPEGDAWWKDLRACGAPAAAPDSALHPQRTVYRRGDPTARDLATRLAALAHGTATGLAPDPFGGALAAGTEGGYVFWLPRAVRDPCRAARDLLPRWAARVVPLVETRAHAIARRGASRWVVDGDGTVLLAPP
jgi:extracellular solute-binding protein (family 5)